MLTSRNATIFLLGLIMIPSVICLQCYVCDQQNDDDCKDDVKDHMRKTCEMKPYGHNGTMVDATGCTVLLSVERNPSGPKSIRRACFYRKDFTKPLGYDGCHAVIRSPYTPYNCTICTEDLCNASPTLQIDTNKSEKKSERKVPSVKCYVCDEQTDSDCRNNLKSDFIQECPRKQDTIYRIVKEASGCAVLISKHTVNDKRTNVKRNCFYGTVGERALTQDEGCTESAAAPFIPYNCTTCEGDVCNNMSANGSSTIYPISIMISLLCVIVKFCL